MRLILALIAFIVMSFLNCNALRVGGRLSRGGSAAFSSSSIARFATTNSATGEAGTMEYRLFFQEGAKTISPWHDIPLKSGEYYNFVNEIPK